MATVLRAVARNVRPAMQARQNSTSAILMPDHSKTLQRLFHTSSVALAVFVPYAVIASSPCKPVDTALGLLLPFHGYYGVSAVISDYVPKAQRPAARAVALGVTALSTLGLLKLNLAGPGLTNTVKTLWRPKKN
eukprot:TRINITY_DN1859_c0_g1::TRINITY_DN1859_c0_g1_i1::g.14097::m.14097 TRINITY_DN1859_c0_g1::TRINITY_DN1859_c0_g1_i1::g.14097  ORF type:complete len:151 (+),score=37.05,sp/Q5RC29/DHSD_PONAB/35.62/1e-07,CybS/PF05328.7/1.4e-16 TRINITY_DN1859_c0_g1_i1:53-454(+)